MDFEFYRNFITVAETGNLTTASKKLRKNIFTPFTVRRQTAALIHSSR